jgi:DNA polymerase, archaea type
MAERIRFFPMEITYRIVDGKAVINIYGKTMDGEQICVIDRNFEPYFYIIPKSIQEVEEKLTKVRVER